MAEESERSRGRDDIMQGPENSELVRSWSGCWSDLDGDDLPAVFVHLEVG